jgi:hypothetical protein
MEDDDSQKGDAAKTVGEFDRAGFAAGLEARRRR